MGDDFRKLDRRSSPSRSISSQRKPRIHQNLLEEVAPLALRIAAQRLEFLQGSDGAAPYAGTDDLERASRPPLAKLRMLAHAGPKDGSLRMEEKVLSVVGLPEMLEAGLIGSPNFEHKSRAHFERENEGRDSEKTKVQRIGNDCACGKAPYEGTGLHLLTALQEEGMPLCRRSSGKMRMYMELKEKKSNCSGQYVTGGEP